MKPHFKTLATILATAVLGGCMPALAAVPLRWTVETSRAAPTRIDVYRGETVTIAADLTSYGRPLELAGSVALYLQTNGMANTWWTVPASISSNRIEATLAPSAYPGDATLLYCYLGGPAVNYRAAFQARILGAPGPAPNTVQPPVVTLDFSAIEVANAPYWTKDEADSRFGGSSITASVVTNIAAAVAARDALPKSGGEAYNLTVGGEFRLAAGAGNFGTIGFAGNDGDYWTDWYVGVPGYWLGTYRLRNLGAGVTATVAFLADIPDLAPYAAAAQVATNAYEGLAGTLQRNAANVVGGDFKIKMPSNITAISDWGDTLRLLGPAQTLVYDDYLGLTVDEESYRWARVELVGDEEVEISPFAYLSEVEAIPMTYTNVAGIASVNCSVQVVVDPANNTVPTFQVPAAVPGGVRDWIVHVVSSGQTDITVTGFPATVDGGKTANFFSPIAAADLTKACTHGTVTTFTFTEINATSSAVNFMVMRAELQCVSPSN